MYKTGTRKTFLKWTNGRPAFHVNSAFSAFSWAFYLGEKRKGNYKILKITLFDVISHGNKCYVVMVTNGFIL